MSLTKRYFEERAEELGLDIELTDETVKKVIEADAELGDFLVDQDKGN